MMLLRRSYLFAIVPLITLSAAALQIPDDLSRIKRSPYYCPPSQPVPPPPPPPTPVPRSFSYPSSGNSGLGWEQFIQREQTYRERNSGDQGQYNAQPFNIGYDQNQFGNYKYGSRPPCEKCGKKKLAVSNAKSDTGDAIAIAVSKGNTG